MATAGAVFLGACASNPTPKDKPNASRSETHYVTGSRLPRRSKSHGDVQVLAPESLESHGTGVTVNSDPRRGPSN